VRHFATKLLLSLVCSFAAELLVALYTVTLVGGFVAAASSISFALPFVSLLSSVWFIEEKKFARRLWLVAASALGYALGTACVMIWWA
jgi:hypothetical protein